VELVIVDNASGDGTLETARELAPRARIVARPTNDGFAAGCNAGIDVARGRRVLLLNPDCAADPEAIQELMAALDADPGVAAAGPRILGVTGHEQPSARSFPSLAREVARVWPRLAESLGVTRAEPSVRPEGGAVDWITGACMLVRREALDEVGTFDEGFFLYFEETDWCRRARAAGWRIVHRPRASVVHEGGRSAARSGDRLVGGNVEHHFRASRRRYFSKHHGRLASAVVEAANAVRNGLDGMRARRAA
jgi:GT2 family glycosyltransferase